MSSSSFIIIANWKSTLSFASSINFYTRHVQTLDDLLKKTFASLILCPSFPVLFPLSQLIANTSIKIGAQNCSPYEKGAYTGEVPASMLAEIGCSYCIIGHSERRILFGETNTIVATKAIRLQQHNIMPIICIGETKEEYEQKKTLAVLEQQLRSLIDIWRGNAITTTQCIIAYEPVWAIGTGIAPSFEHLSQTYECIKKIIDAYCNATFNIQYKLIYGGSVQEETVPDIKKTSLIQGFLIGNASTDFQRLQNIVRLST